MRKATSMGLVAAGLWISFVLSAWAGEIRVSAIKVEEKFDLPTPGAAVAVIWSPDGAVLAAASDYGGVLTAWDRNGHVINQFKRLGDGPAVSGSLAFVQGSSQLVFLPPPAVGNSAALAVWDVATGEIIRVENGPQPGADYPLNRAEHFMTSPDQTMLAAATNGTVGSKNLEKNVIVYDTRSWRVLQTAKFVPGVTSLSVFGEGRLLGLGSISGGHIGVLDFRTGVVVHQIPAYEESKYGSFTLGAIAGSPGGDLIFAGVGSMLLKGEYRDSPDQRKWADSLDSVRLLRVKDGSRVAALSSARVPIRQAVWDPKGRYVAFIDSAQGLFLWAPWRNLDCKKVDLPSPTLSVAVAPDGNEIAVTTNRGVRVYSIS